MIVLWIVGAVVAYMLLRYFILTDRVAVEDFDINWLWWLLCIFIGHRYTGKKYSAMFVYCDRCGVPGFHPEYWY